MPPGLYFPITEFFESLSKPQKGRKVQGQIALSDHRCVRLNGCGDSEVHDFESSILYY